MNTEILVLIGFIWSIFGATCIWGRDNAELFGLLATITTLVLGMLGMV